MTTHGSLFSGIGGIDLGFQWAGIETLWQVERDPFCQRVLGKNFPKAQRFSDVRLCGRHNLEQVDVISGGFPCQNISVEGNRKGLDGEKSRLWFEQARIIRELRPAWVLIENVSRLLHTEGDRILAEMEAAGYECWPFVLGAREVGATHKRSRAWILCHRADADGHGSAVEPMGILPPEAVREMAGAVEGWNHRARELASGTVGIKGDAYARIAREDYGLSDWLDRHKALGNAVVPQIPMLFGCFIQKMSDANCQGSEPMEKTS